MSTTIYRKYRPMTFKELVNQEHVSTTLQNEIRHNQLAHAYLFSGPRGLGKTTTARLLAKAINCQNRKETSAEPCNTCESCLSITNNQSLDFIEIDAASNRGINEIRELKEHVGFTPAGSAYRVFVIDEVHMLTTEAFNALLKTLEEPPKHALFILATTELHKVPDTIISRCQTFRFKKADPQALYKRLETIVKKEGVSVEKSVLQQIVRQSEGYIRDAESLLGQVLSLGEKDITAETASLVLSQSQHEHVVAWFEQLQERDATAAIKKLHELTDHDVDMAYFAREALEMVRLLLLVRFNAAAAEEQLQQLSGRFTERELVRLAHLLNRAITDLKTAVIPELPLELLVIEFCEDAENREQRTGNRNNQDNNSNLKSNVALTEEAKQDTTSEEKNIIKKEQKTKRQPLLTLDALVKQWQQVIDTGRKHNHSISLALKMAHPVACEEDTVHLGCSYDFHRGRLNDEKNNKLIQEIFSEVFGALVKIVARPFTPEEEKMYEQNNSEDKKQQEDKFVEEALNILGGQVVSD